MIGKVVAMLPADAPARREELAGGLEPVPVTGNRRELHGHHR
jgi:hypothetical protein